MMNSGQKACSHTHLIEAFQHGLTLLAKDTLLDVFRSSSESQQFMFDRIREILIDCIRAAGIDPETGKTSTKKFTEQTFKGNEFEYGSSQSAKVLELMREVESLKEENKKLCSKVISLAEKQAVVSYQTNSTLGDETKDYGGYSGVNNLEDRLTLERNLKNMRLKLNQTQEELRALTEGEKTWKLKLETKSKALEEVKEKMMALERENKKLVYDKKECEEALTRKCRLLDEENAILRQRHSEMSSGFEKNMQDSDIRNSLKSLEIRYVEIKEHSKTAARKLEESEFTNEQLRLTIGSLKQELTHLNELLKQVRSSGYSIELQLIESKEREADLRLQMSTLETQLNKLAQELSMANSNLREAEDSLKQEKKKSIEFERINEQLVFTTGRSKSKFRQQ